MSNWQLWFVRRACILVVLCMIGLMLPWLTRALAGTDMRVAWLVDLAAHWQWLYVIGLVATSAVAAWSDRRWLLALIVAPLPLLSAAPSAPAATGAAVDFVVASANVHLDSVDVQPLADWLTQAQPDVVVVLEVSPIYAEALRRLGDYPHQHIAAANDPFGIALLSRHPFASVAVRSEASEPARIDALIQTPRACVALTALHPMPPIAAAFHQARNARLRLLALEAGLRDVPSVVAGDLNATPWSSAFAGLAVRGLRRASDLRPSWPSAGLGLIGIPIDHVLVSKHWSVHSSTRGPAIGSDHWPVVVQLGLDATTPRAACAPENWTR